MEIFWSVIALLAFLIGLYNVYMIAKLSKSIYWILTHVLIVPKKKGGRKDAEFDAIKNMFGIADNDGGDVTESLDDISDSID